MKQSVQPLSISDEEIRALDELLPELAIAFVGENEYTIKKLVEIYTERGLPASVEMIRVSLDKAVAEGRMTSVFRRDPKTKRRVLAYIMVK